MFVMNQKRNLILNSDKLMGFEIEQVPHSHYSVKAIVDGDYYTLAIYEGEDRAKKILNDMLETMVNNYPGFEMPLK